MDPMDRAAGSLLLREEGSAGTEAPALEYAGQMFHLPAACGPIHSGKHTKDEQHHNFEVLVRGTSAGHPGGAKGAV